MTDNSHKLIGRLLGSSILACMLFSCFHAPAGVQEEISFHSEKLHRYLTIVYKRQTPQPAEHGTDTVTYYCNSKGLPILERWGTDSTDDACFSYVGDTIFYQLRKEAGQYRESRSYFIIKNGLIVESDTKKNSFIYEYDGERRLTCRKNPSTVCDALHWQFTWKGRKMFFKPMNIVYQQSDKVPCHNFYYLRMLSGAIDIPLPLVQLGYLGTVPDGNLFKITFHSMRPFASFSTRFTSEYDEKGRPTHIIEETTQPWANGKTACFRTEMQCIW